MNEWCFGVFLITSPAKTLPDSGCPASAFAEAPRLMEYFARYYRNTIREIQRLDACGWRFP
jgi:hypothetical protein